VIARRGGFQSFEVDLDPYPDLPGAPHLSGAADLEQGLVVAGIATGDWADGGVGGAGTGAGAGVGAAGSTADDAQRSVDGLRLLHGLFQLVETHAQVGHQGGAEGHIHSGKGGQGAGHLIGCPDVSSTETLLGIGWSLLLGLLQLAEMLHCDFQNVGLLELGIPRLGNALGHQILQLVQALVDPGTTLPLQQRLHHLAVLIGLGHLVFGGHCVGIFVVS